MIKCICVPLCPGAGIRMICVRWHSKWSMTNRGVHSCLLGSIQEAWRLSRQCTTSTGTERRFILFDFKLVLSYNETQWVQGQIFIVLVKNINDLWFSFLLFFLIFFFTSAAFYFCSFICYGKITHADSNRKTIAMVLTRGVTIYWYWW